MSNIIENRDALSAEQSQGSEPPSSTHDILVAARALIEKPENWCGSGWGHDDQRCAVRAIAIAYSVLNGFPAEREILGCDAENFMHKHVGDHLGSFNDTHSHTEVLTAFDKAIAECAP